MPVLGGPLAEVIAAGELTVDHDDPRGPSCATSSAAFPLARDTEATAARASCSTRSTTCSPTGARRPERINYRRFFDITDLVSLRQEDPEVFDATHATILDLIADGSITGLRIDHVDGLADPAGYLARLEAATNGIYVVVEKILAADESLPDGWPVAGTTGYEALDAIGSVLVDAGGAGELEALQARVAGIDAPFHQIALAAKREIMQSSFPRRPPGRRADARVAGRGRHRGDRGDHRPARGLPHVRRQRRSLR